METRANHVLIGVFTVTVLAGALGFILWLAGTRIDQRFTTYDILFEGSVSGLNVAGDVRYQGVRVGQVKEIRIYEKDHKLVRVRVEIDANTPVNSASRASLEFFGITGVLFVQINSGAADAPPLETPPGHDVPIIASSKSDLEELFSGAPRLLENAVVLVERLNHIVDADNRNAIRGILTNAETISGKFASRADDIDEMIVNVNQMTRNIADLTERLDGLGAQAEILMNGDVKKLLREASSLTAGVNQMVIRNQDAVNSFGDRGLREFTVFISEARQLVTTLDRIAQRMESDPARFFLGAPASEYTPE